MMDPYNFPQPTLISGFDGNVNNTNESNGKDIEIEYNVKEGV